MLTIPNLPTQDKYVDALTLGPVPTARALKYLVANKAVFARIWPMTKDGTIPAQTDELLITPETNIITDAMGIQFRSAVQGVPAQVVAQLLTPGDPLLGSGTPFSSTISSSGGIQPGVSSVQVQKDGALIGTEPILDLLTGALIGWTVADDPANTRVTVAPRLVAVTGRYASNAGGVNILNGTGFTVARLGAGNCQVNFTTAFAAVPLVLPSADDNTGVAPSAFTANVATNVLQIVRTVGGVATDGVVQFLAIGFV